MGSVIKRGKNYYIYYWYDGKKIGKKISPSKKQAETVLKKIEVEIAEGKYLDKREKPVKITFDEMACKYLEWSKANKRSWSRDELSLKHLKDYFVDKNLSDVSPFLIEGYKMKRKSEVSPRTVNLELACLKHLFTKAIEWNFAKENPVKRVKFFRINNARVRYLSEEEIARLLNASDDHLKPIILTALHTGLRKSGILNMRWKDVDFRNGIIHIPDSKSGDKIDIPMSEVLKETLLNLKKNADTEFVFTTINGERRPLKDIRTIFSSALKKAGITDFRFHDLRHTFASHLVMNGVDLKTVQELLGHKTFSMTLRYSHLSPEHKKEAVKVMDRIAENSNGNKLVTKFNILTLREQ